MNARHQSPWEIMQRISTQSEQIKIPTLCYWRENDVTNIPSVYLDICDLHILAKRQQHLCIHIRHSHSTLTSLSILYLRICEKQKTVKFIDQMPKANSKTK